MLPPASLPVPGTWREVLEELRPALRRHSTHVLLMTLACGMILAGCCTAPGRLVLGRDPGSGKPCDLGLFSLDTSASPEATAERCSWRWPIQPANATAKQVLGAGDASNRTKNAVERTVPFAFLVQSLLITWCARYAHSTADVERRRRVCP